MSSFRRGWTVLLTLGLVPPSPVQAGAQTQAPPTADAGTQQQAAAKPLKTEELEQLAAPIALYPDALLAQVLMASTYPLEVVQASRWLEKNSKLKGEELNEAVQKQPWEPSVRSLTAVPDVLKMMNEKLDWTQKLGDAVLAQQEELMAAVQTLRKKAKDEGNLKSTEQQKVSTQETGSATGAKTEVIVIEPAKPDVIYVPQYDPVVVYGTWAYPSYPPYYYYPPGYMAATSMISFGIGLTMGAALWGGCNWGYGWGGGNVQINNFNNYNRVNKTNVSNRNWQHNSAHRGGVAYRDGATAQRYGRDGQTGAGTREAYRGRSGEGARGGGDFSGARTGDRAQARQQPSGSRGSAFEGSGGSGRQARMDSARGQSSRQSYGGGRGGGGRSFGGGGRGGGRR